MNRAKARMAPGFTLIEVTLGLAILVLIFGVIFQLVQLSVLGADAAGKASLRSREVSGLFALVRQLCLDLPIRSQLRLERGAGEKYELVLSHAPVAILPSQDEGQTSLRFRVGQDPGAGGRKLTLQEVFVKTNQRERSSKSETNSFVLMQDVVSVTWAAADPRKPAEKMEEVVWSDPIKPAYLKLTLVRRSSGQDITNTGIFWIPTGYGSEGQPPIDPVTRVPLQATNAVPPPA